MANRVRVMIFGMLCLSVLAAGCKKKVAVGGPPPQAQVPPRQPESTPVKTSGPAQPLAQPARIESFTAEPASVQRNQAVTLRWTVSGTNPELVLDPGLGIVTPNGSRQVFPPATTTYTLTARNALFTDVRSVTVEVRNAPAPPKAPATGALDPPATILAREAQDVYFDYDMSELREDARQALNNNAELLRRIFASDPAFTVVLEGHADERGSAEYNIGLAGPAPVFKTAP